ncbi:hypothetical protein GC173_02040 [bacterium]|nr:hypothetical protein [bacterium]
MNRLAHSSAAAILLVVTATPAVLRAEGERRAVSCAHTSAHMAEYLHKAPEKVSPKALKLSRSNPKSGVTFTLTYNDMGTGAGFDDPTFGAQRRETVDAVIAYLGTVLHHPGGKCDILIRQSELDGTGFLAFATPLYVNQPGFAAGTAHSHIVDRVDQLNDRADIEITFDFGYPWNSGMGDVELTEFDLFSVALHEVGHGLGLISLTNASGGSVFSPGVLTTWDRRLYSSNPFGRLWNDSGAIQNAGALAGGPGAVQFFGEQASQVLGFNPLVYAQNQDGANVFEQGVTMTHWQDTAPNPDSLTVVLGPIYYSGDQIRQFHPFELGALRDLGYFTSARDPELTPGLAGPLLQGTAPNLSEDYNSDQILDAADVVATGL